LADPSGSTYNDVLEELDFLLLADPKFYLSGISNGQWEDESPCLDS